jgi:hypothetical protein
VCTPCGYYAVLLELDNQQLPFSPEVLQLFFDELFERTVFNAHLGKLLL